LTKSEGKEKVRKDKSKGDRRRKGISKKGQRGTLQSKSTKEGRKEEKRIEEVSEISFEKISQSVKQNISMFFSLN